MCRSAMDHTLYWLSWRLQGACAIAQAMPNAKLMQGNLFATNRPVESVIPKKAVAEPRGPTLASWSQP